MGMTKEMKDRLLSKSRTKKALSKHCDKLLAKTHTPTPTIFHTQQRVVQSIVQGQGKGEHYLKKIETRKVTVEHMTKGQKKNVAKKLRKRWKPRTTHVFIPQERSSI